jgi:hypothetical protein
VSRFLCTDLVYEIVIVLCGHINMSYTKSENLTALIATDKLIRVQVVDNARQIAQLCKVVGKHCHLLCGYLAGFL